MIGLEETLAFMPEEPPAIDAWCAFLLGNLEEFTTLAWYLVADGKLVEETFARTMAHLDKVPFDACFPEFAYHQVRKMVITQAVAIAGRTHREDAENSRVESDPLGELPKLARLAFLLRMVIRSSPIEVAEFLEITPSEVRNLVCFAIDQLCGSVPASQLAESREA